MTAAERLARQRLEARVNRLEPTLRRRFLQALAQARETADVGAAARALEQGDLAGAMRALFPDDSVQQLQERLHVDAIRVLLEGARGAMRTEIPARLRVRIDGPSPAVMEALDRQLVRDIAPIVEQAREGLRETLASGLRQGVNPRQVAVEARSAIGLSPYDVRLVESFELQLRGDPGAALVRELRDRRFDPTVQKALSGVPLTEEQIRAMREAYAARLHAWRAETYARTTSINALREGQLAAWRTATEGAGIPPEDMVKTWVTTLDGRERPEHHAAHGTTVLIDEKFPVDGGVMVPGENVYNCRCAMTFRVLPRDPARRAAFLADPSRRPRGRRTPDPTTPE